MRALFRSLYRLAARALVGTNISRIGRVRQLDRWVRRRIRAESVEIDGSRYYVDEFDSLNLTILGRYEPIESALLERVVKPGCVAVDLGANIGFHAVRMARCAGPAGRVYAFEPDPVNFALLKRNLEANGFAHATPEQKAISDKKGVLTLYRCASDPMDHRTHPGDGQRAGIDVEAISLDDYFRDSGTHVDFIKMDVQGAEIKALNGMREVIARSPGLEMLVEFWPYGLRQCDESPEHYLAMLQELGFHLFGYDEARAEWGTVSPEFLLATYSDEVLADTTNIWCRCSEELDE